jgi:hypothetical protein
LQYELSQGLFIAGRPVPKSIHHKIDLFEGQFIPVSVKLDFVMNEKFLSTVCELVQRALFIIQIGVSINADKTLIVFFYQQQEVRDIQETYTIWNGIVVQKSS